MRPFFSERDIDPKYRSIIRRKVRALVGRYGITESDTLDLEQDLIIHLWEHPVAYDPSRASQVGVACCLLDRKIANVIEKKRAIKRNRGVCDLSLDDEVQTSNGRNVARGDVCSSKSAFKSRERTDAELWALRIDIECALRRLPPQLHEIALLLQEYSKSEVARMLGIRWSTFCDRCREIRGILKRYDIDKYA